VLQLDEIIPAPDFRERHELHIAAPPAAVWYALQDVRLGDLALSRMLLAIRSLPERLAGRVPSSVTSGRFLENAPVPVLVAEAERAVIAAGVLQPWKLSGGQLPPVLDVPGLVAFSDPGWVKTGIDFVLYPESDGTRLTTETRVLATDPRTRARFRLYWLLIRAGSGLIRRDLLRAVARRAERRTRPPTST